jgi:hypothetical protein
MCSMFHPIYKACRCFRLRLGSCHFVEHKFHVNTVCPDDITDLQHVSVMPFNKYVLWHVSYLNSIASVLRLSLLLKPMAPKSKFCQNRKCNWSWESLDPRKRPADRSKRGNELASNVTWRNWNEYVGNRVNLRDPRGSVNFSG